MHPKSSKRSQSRRGGDPRITAFPLQRRRPRSTPGTAFLFLLAIVMAGAGVLTRFGENLDPRLLVVGESVDAWGLDPGTLFVGGLVLLGVAMTCRQLRVHAATILAPSGVDEALTEIGADLAEFRNKLYDLGNDQVEMLSVLQSMRQEAEQHRAGDRTDEVVEATFRVAGSLDTLHAKLDQRVGSAQESIVQGLYELTHLVEASRDFLQETLEETQQAQSALGEEVRRELDDFSRRAPMPMAMPPQFAMQDSALAAMLKSIAQGETPRPGEEPDEGTGEEPARESAAGEEPTPEVGDLGERHDANAWFRADEESDGADEQAEELQIAMPDGALPDPSGVQQARLGLLDRFGDDAEDSGELDEEPAESEASPMSVLDDMERAMEEEQTAEPPDSPEPLEPPEAAKASEEPLEVRFDRPPQAPGHVHPQGPDGTTIVQLDDPGAALPAPPPDAPAPNPLPPSWAPDPRSR